MARQLESIRLGRNRLELEAELRALTEKVASFGDHMTRAMAAHDMATVEDLAIEMHGIDRQIEEASFLLGLIYEAVK